MTPTEFIRAMSEEDKERVFLALLREALGHRGDTALMHVEDEDGRSFGYFVPPKAAAAQFRSLAPMLSAEQREATNQALSTLGDTFDMKAFLDDLTLEDGKQG